MNMQTIKFNLLAQKFAFENQLNEIEKEYTHGVISQEKFEFEYTEIFTKFEACDKAFQILVKIFPK